MLTKEMIDELMVQGPWRPETKKTYRRNLLMLMEWLDREGLEIQSLRAADFVRWMDERNWKSKTRKGALAAARHFIRHNIGSKHPLMDIKIRQEESPPQRILAFDQILQLMDYLEVADPTDREILNAAKVRNMAIFCLMLDTGLRATEVCGLNLKHLDMEGRRFKAECKGGTWGDGVFSENTRVRLQHWLQLRRIFAAKDTEEVFVGISGIHPGEKMTRDGLGSICKAIGKRVGFHFSPHDFRRTFATMAIQNGAPTRLVQVAGRWKTLSMVELYTRSITASAFEPYSPVAMIDAAR